MTTTKMTREMRRSLIARMTQIEKRIEHLQQERDGDDAFTNMPLELQLKRELAEIADSLADAVLVETTPFDTHAIEIGDSVTIRSEEGAVETYVLVDDHVGTRVQDDWVSISSPLGGALLGRSVEDVVLVQTPEGAIAYTILGFERSGSGEPDLSFVGESGSPAA